VTSTIDILWYMMSFGFRGRTRNLMFRIVRVAAEVPCRCGGERPGVGSRQSIGSAAMAVEFGTLPTAPNGVKPNPPFQWHLHVYIQYRYTTCLKSSKIQHFILEAQIPA
jgi:hypothetical protein